MKNTSPEIGTSFHGYQLESRLDRCLNPFRMVFKSGSHVLTIIDLGLTPHSFLTDSSEGKVPVEFLYVKESAEAINRGITPEGCVIDFNEHNPFGIPAIYDMGITGQYAWYVSEFLEGHLFCEEGDQGPDMELLLSMYGFIAVVLQRYHLSRNVPNRICITPRSILLVSDEDGVPYPKFMLGDMFCPSTNRHDYPKSYDLRYLAPDSIFTPYSVSVSAALLMLYFVKNRFPFNIRKDMSQEAIWNKIQSYRHEIFDMGFSEDVSKYLYRCLGPVITRPQMDPEVFNGLNEESDMNPYPSMIAPFLVQ